ncbi:PREDICTED: golgin subfamily A member 6-like protein 22 [Fragaria vesca subsp. vesca]|uniref:golgin subfamily A member 6-like protein 22 n=1 Tax=Fragaria vesca subsp. vesca TaxID=101020 RepID=UPI0002C2EC25|nr:PREDICTED: golgin subfamily A member 6-like protein 22 [Fragaria vesca subsp. vesca]XP_011470252.1 PREDICTED: golgin subfamily A member 6-like protein 22 [Fragaria vesca subsp. vesca]XP_011470253.1 PREDICTED: golgin subfamily A member 6-like protein 22 [Fragaria vesca subsp. vesca]XP_011470254.1 PREDICTED: golgin subfamily A member 6-like protein 22 [Fragaria vesca subsp. vesca]
MEEKVVTNPYLIVSEDKSDSLYPTYFGVSCAFFALRLLSISDVQDERLSEVRDKMLRGSAQLLGLLMWRVQKEEKGGGKECELLHKLEIAEREIRELKRLRHDDAKANEKVVSIFAAQEQSWLNERKKLRQHIGALMSGLRVFEKKKDQAITHWNEKMKEMEHLVQSKDKALGDMEQKLKEFEEKLREAENVAEELREKAKSEAQQHSSEILKHRTAFIELVSSQRQLDADMGRALRQVEATKREFNLVLDQKEESVLMVQKLSAEIVKMHKDLEQKDKILSAMLRKSKLDISEKQMLVKEIKLSKAKRKQAELETERWKVVSESKHERHSLRSMLEKANSKFEIALNERGMNTSATGTSHLGYENPEFRNESVQYSFEENVDLADMKQLEGWVRSEAERYAAVIEQRHHLEIDAFIEQLRLKDEKLETYQWRLLSMEIESKRLDSHLEGLNKEISQLRHNNMKLEALLSEREEESTSLKGQFASQLRFLHSQMNNFKSKAEEKNQKRETGLVELSPEEGTKKENETSSYNESNDQTLEVQSPDKVFETEKNVLHEGTSEEGSVTCASPVEVNGAEKLVISSPGQASGTNNNSLWRMDLQALGVSYKIKRLKQQLLMLERFTGKHDNGEDHKEGIDEGQSGMKGYLSLMSLLNKQVGRYQSLQGKVDDLCQRMHENDLDGNGRRGDSDVARTKDKSKTLENFLDETFQLQRYMVATGQRLMEILPKISPGIVGIAVELEKCASFDMNRFTEFIRTLFQEVQRGLEVRIARMIGDLEGTLACDGMIHLRR